MSPNSASCITEQNQLILNALSEGVYGLDAEYRITFANQAVAGLLGWREDELVGQDSLALLHRVRSIGSPFSEGEYPLTWVEAGGSIYNIEELLCCKDGSTLPVEFSMSPLSNNLSGSAMVVVFRDISERKENHHRLAQAFHDMAEMNSSLDKARSRLQQSEKMVAVGQLAAGMAHEINNPIGFVQSNLGSLSKYIQALLSLIDQYGDLEKNGAITPDNLGRINDLKKAIDFDFLRDDLGDLLEESRRGIERVRR